jgi:hypothetical protein
LDKEAKGRTRCNLTKIKIEKKGSKLIIKEKQKRNAKQIE